MTRVVEHIERDIAALEQSVAAIAQEFHTTYHQYLSALGETVRQQLVLAAYYVCTQGYPDRFLALSLNQRQELQKNLRELGRQVQTQLQEQLAPTRAADGANPQPVDSAVDQTGLSFRDESSVFAEGLQFSEDLVPASDDRVPDSAIVMLSPAALAGWHESLERSILDVLQTFSQSANLLLQQAEILPNQLPDIFLEVAAQAGAETVAGPPNLLNLLMETETDEEPSKVMHIMAIRLRLSEIEFNNSTLIGWRSKIRGLLTRLNHLGREYQKKQREKAIAAAEEAWRAIWFEE